MLARDVLTVLTLESGERWIDAARDFQREDALAVLEGEEPYSFLTRSRGSSKTTDLAAVALSVLVAADHRLRAYWLAADADQGRLAVDAIAGFVARTPTLAGRWRAVSTCRRGGCWSRSRARRSRCCRQMRRARGV